MRESHSHPNKLFQTILNYCGFFIDPLRYLISHPLINPIEQLICSFIIKNQRFMLILYIALGSFALGGAIVLGSNIVSTAPKSRKSYRY
jgi:hypothetical protein